MKLLHTKRAAFAAVLVATFGVSLGARALAFDDEEKKGDESEEAEDKSVPEEEKTAWFAVTHADIYTGTGEILRDATLLAKDGKIVEIGYDVDIPGRDYYTDVPEEKRDFRVDVLDAQGMRVYPGLVAISSSGLLGTGGDFRDSIDPFSSNMVLGLAAGIDDGPGPLGGQAQALRPARAAAALRLRRHRRA